MCRLAPASYVVGSFTIGNLSIFFIVFTINADESPQGPIEPQPGEPSRDLNICHQWRGQGTQAHDLPIWQHISIFTTFEKQSMINRLSNPINRNRSAAKISKVMSSNNYAKEAKNQLLGRLSLILMRGNAIMLDSRSLDEDIPLCEIDGIE